MQLLDTSLQLFREYKYLVLCFFCSTSLPRWQPHCKIAIDWLNACNTIAFLSKVIWISLLLLQQGSYKMHRPGVRFVSLTRPLYTTSPECDHSQWGSFRILAQVSQYICGLIKSLGTLRTRGSSPMHKQLFIVVKQCRVQ